MNFKTVFNEGQLGKNVGLSTGLPALDRAIDGIQKKNIINLGAGPKVGKTTLADYTFVLSPYLHDVLDKGKDVEWKYFSYEVDRISKEFKFAAFFMHNDYEEDTFKYKDKIYNMSPRYLLGRLKDQDDKLIPVADEHVKLLKEIYVKRLIPLFGKYDHRGKKLTNGLIDFIEQRGTPSDIYSYILNYSRNNGKFVTEPYTILEKGIKVTKNRIIGYEPNNPDKHVILITDHVRKIKRPQRMNLKDTVDQFAADQVELRNWCKYTFVNIIHLNRNMDDIKRMQFNKEFLYPTGGDFKDTGNLSEEGDITLTMMNPTDTKYNITKHFGVDISESPFYRSLHLVDSRHTECPRHLRMNMYGNINCFEEMEKNTYN